MNFLHWSHWSWSLHTVSFCTNLVVKWNFFLEHHLAVCIEKQCLSKGVCTFLERCCAVDKWGMQFPDKMAPSPALECPQRSNDLVFSTGGFVACPNPHNLPRTVPSRAWPSPVLAALAAQFGALLACPMHGPVLFLPVTKLNCFFRFRNFRTANWLFNDTCTQEQKVHIETRPPPVLVTLLHVSDPRFLPQALAVAPKVLNVATRTVTPWHTLKPVCMCPLLLVPSLCLVLSLCNACNVPWAQVSITPPFHTFYHSFPLFLSCLTTVFLEVCLLSLRSIGYSLQKAIINNFPPEVSSGSGVKEGNPQRNAPSRPRYPTPLNSRDILLHPWCMHNTKTLHFQQKTCLISVLHCSTFMATFFKNYWN